MIIAVSQLKHVTVLGQFNQCMFVTQAILNFHLEELIGSPGLFKT